jgi:peptide chain release factor subunit 3
MELNIRFATLPTQALLHLIDKKTGRRTKRPPQFVKQGQKVIARIETDQPVCVETFEDYPQLGRFTVRDEGSLSISLWMTSSVSVN